ncbi:MAG: LytTR family DNA-binding domain-containing protein [Eubacteriales bacterium]|nr:LytTR family DNA-binding domain-containing protein [Eubacteriales bacterium]
MISLAIVEDDDRCVDILTKYLHRYEEENEVRFRIQRYRDGYEIVEKYPSDTEIILMDIEMGLMDGMEAAGQIRQTDESVEIIFVTNMAQYAIQGYRVRALDYILKPVEYLPFSESLHRALRRISARREKYLLIPSRSGTVKIPASVILWVESSGHRLTFHEKGGKSLETTVYSMKEVENELKNRGFAKSNSGCLINLAAVDGFNDREVTIDGHRLPISRGQKASFMAELIRYING